jgi:hypothetical protein
MRIVLAILLEVRCSKPAENDRLLRVHKYRTQRYRMLNYLVYLITTSL